MRSVKPVPDTDDKPPTGAGSALSDEALEAAKAALLVPVKAGKQWWDRSKLGPWNKTLKVGGWEIKDRILNEVNNNSVVTALFLTVSCAALLSPPDTEDTALRRTYLMGWWATLCLQLLSLMLTLSIMTSLNKLGSPEAVIEYLKMVQSYGPLPVAFALTHANWICTGLCMLVTGQFFVDDPTDIQAARSVFLFTILAIALLSVGLKWISIRASQLAGDTNHRGEPLDQPELDP